MQRTGVGFPVGGLSTTPESRERWAGTPNMESEAKEEKNEGVEAAAELKAAGAEALKDGRSGLRIGGWMIQSRNGPILNSSSKFEPYFHDLDGWVDDGCNIGTSHLPEMVFGESCLILSHLDTGVKIHFNAFDALKGWKQEALPPIEVPAAAKWKFRSKPFQQVILDYDYTFTTPYCGSEAIEPRYKQTGDEANAEAGTCSLQWEDCEEQIDLVALASKEPILFYDEAGILNMTEADLLFFIYIVLASSRLRCHR
ncbi:hypothetical protein ACLOJK_038231 [Asimina triloba]